MTSRHARHSPESNAVRTFLITDIRGYTAFTVAHGDVAAAQLSSRFSALAEDVIQEHHGRVVEVRGDEVMGVFSSARQGLRAALALQERAGRQPQPIPAGAGLDAGEAVSVNGGFRGVAVNLAARLCSIAHAGEVLASSSLVHLAGRTLGLTYEDGGMVELKGFVDPVKVIRVRPEDQVEGHDADRQAVLPVSPAHVPEGGFLGARPSGALVARSLERTTVVEMLDAARTGHGGLVLISGEPGVGKTRLGQAITVDASELGFLVATGRCYEPQEAVPFYPFREAMTVAFASAGPEAQATACSQWPFLARLVPGMPVKPPDSSPTSHEEQQRLHAAVSGFLRSLAQKTPVALLLDDLHWADASSLGLLQTLARELRAEPVFILATFRDADLGRDHHLQRTLLDLSREQLVRRITLKPFALEETCELARVVLDGEVDPSVCERLHVHSSGNPFFAEELLRELRESDGIYRDQGAWRLRRQHSFHVPETIRLVIAQRLARLSPETQSLLSEASVLGQTFSFDELQALSGRPDDALDLALDEATEADLLKLFRDERYTFNHGLTQQALYLGLPPRRRRRLHLRAGEAFETKSVTERTRRAAEMAWHFAEASDPRAFGYAVMAGDQAEGVWAHRDARVHFDLALEIATAEASSDQEAIVREKLGGLATATIDYDDALASLERSAQLYRETGQYSAEARVVAQIGRVHGARGTLEEGISRVATTLPSLGGSEPEQVAGAHSALARLYYAADRYDEAAGAARDALGRLAGTTADGVRAEAEVTFGAAVQLQGRWAEGEQEIHRGIRTAEAGGDLFTICRGRQHLAAIRLAQGRFRDASDLLAQALDLARRMANHRQVANTLLAMAVSSFLEGRPDDGPDEALDIMRSLGGVWFRPLLVAGLAVWVYPFEAMAPSLPLRQAMELSESPLREVRESMAEASRLHASGSMSAARAIVEALLENPGVPTAQGWAVQALLAQILIDVGEFDGAGRLIKSGVAESSGLRIQEVTWRHAAGRLALLRGDPGSAEAELLQVAEECTRMPYPYGVALSNRDLGRVRLAQGRTTEARTLLEQARDEFGRLQAERDREVVVAMLSELD